MQALSILPDLDLVYYFLTVPCENFLVFFLFSFCFATVHISNHAFSLLLDSSSPTCLMALDLLFASFRFVFLYHKHSSCYLIFALSKYWSTRQFSRMPQSRSAGSRTVCDEDGWQHLRRSHNCLYLYYCQCKPPSQISRPSEFSFRFRCKLALSSDLSTHGTILSLF